MSNTKQHNYWRQEISKMLGRSSKVRIPKAGLKNRTDKRQLSKATDYLGLTLLKETPKCLVFVLSETDGNNRVNLPKGANTSE